MLVHSVMKSSTACYGGKSQGVFPFSFLQLSTTVNHPFPLFPDHKSTQCKPQYSQYLSRFLLLLVHLALLPRAAFFKYRQPVAFLMVSSIRKPQMFANSLGSLSLFRRVEVEDGSLHQNYYQMAKSQQRILVRHVLNSASTPDHHLTSAYTPQVGVIRRNFPPSIILARIVSL